MPNQTLYDNFSQVRQYIDQEKPDLSSYVSKSELAEMGYISSIPVKYPTLTGFTIPSGASEVNFRSGGLTIDNTTYNLYPSTITYTNAKSESARTWIGMGTLKNYVDGRISEIESSYATTSYVVDYVTEHGGGGSTVIDENIIPKENNTYTLGDSSYIYSTSYITDMWLSGTNKFSNRSNNQVNLMLNNAWKYVFHANNFSPANDNAINLGESSVRWRSTYTASLYTDTAYLQDTSYSSSIIPKETGTYTLGDVDHLYNAAYTSRVKVGNNSQMYNDGGGITFSVNNNNGIRIGGSTFYPKTNKGYSNGSSTNYWDSTYTSRVDLNTNIALTSDGSGLFVKTAGNLKFSFDADSFHPYGSTYSGLLDLGTSTRTWRSTYTANLYADNIHNFIWIGTSAEYATLSDYTTYQFYLIENE